MTAFHSTLPFLLVFGLFAVAPAGAAVPNPKAIEESLTCQCGCGLTVHTCNHLQCGSAIPLKQEVASLISEGLDHDTIMVRFQEKYGEKILSAPTTEGFNLTAWVTPFLMLGFGTVLVVVVVRRWSGPKASDSETPVADLTDEERERLDKALRDD